jgi:hypothetical protein
MAEGDAWLPLLPREIICCLLNQFMRPFVAVHSTDAQTKNNLGHALTFIGGSGYDQLANSSPF